MGCKSISITVKIKVSGYDISYVRVPRARQEMEMRLHQTATVLSVGDRRQYGMVEEELKMRVHTMYTVFQ